MLDTKTAKRSTSRSFTDSRIVRRIMGRLVRNKKSFINKRRVQSLEYLDVGCGPNTHDDFINLDAAWGPGIDICWDLGRGELPLQDATLAGVFSEHCLEHLCFEASTHLIAEFRRVLRPGGVARVSVPDGELYLDIYARRKLSADAAQTETDEFPYEKTDRAKAIYSPIASVNRIARGHQHLYLYDFAMMKLVFERAGFVDVSRAEYGQGRDDKLLIDSEHRAIESLYVEAVAP